MNPFVNQYPEAAQKFFLQLLPKKIAAKHWSVIERICYSIHNERDYKQLAAMLVEVYQAGFTLSVNEHKKSLNKAGIEVNIVPPKPSSPKIFK
jgi:hypothetical protein